MECLDSMVVHMLNLLLSLRLGTELIQSPWLLYLFSLHKILYFLFCDQKKLTAGVLMTYYIGALKSGLDNTTLITKYTRSMAEVNIFAGRVKYNASTGDNTKFALKPFQFKEGYGSFITEDSPIVYPAPWPWNPRTDLPPPVVGM